MSLELKSFAFQHGEVIPKPHTGDGDDVSPPLHWSDPPEDTGAFALICDDPDAPGGTWDHWVLYDIPADRRKLEEGIPGGKEDLNGHGKQGRNDFDNLGYGGPAPPAGETHHYFFKLYALDRETGLEPGASKQKVLGAIEDHILDQAELMGIYGR